MYNRHSHKPSYNLFIPREKLKENDIIQCYSLKWYDGRNWTRHKPIFCNYISQCDYFPEESYSPLGVTIFNISPAEPNISYFIHVCCCFGLKRKEDETEEKKRVCCWHLVDKPTEQRGNNTAVNSPENFCEPR